MITNKQILEAFITALNNAALGYDIAWPGVDFMPPDSGIWLALSHIPNQGVQDGIEDAADVVPRGMFQMSAYTRPGSGVFGITSAADTIVSTFTKGTVLSSPVRITRTPYQSPRVDEPDRIYIPVTIEYSG